MDTLTIWQPWATLLVNGTKKYETRTWAPPRPHLKLGTPIGIHTAKKRTPYSQLSQAIHDEISRAEYERLPHGVLIGIGTLVSISQVMHSLEPPYVKAYTLNENGVKGITQIETDPFGDFSPKRILWEFKDMIKIDPPYPCKGHQGLWNFKYGYTFFIEGVINQKINSRFAPKEPT